MSKVVLHLGSNISDRKKYIDAALQLIECEVGEILLKSQYYETEAWGESNQQNFINVGILVETEIEPFKLLKKLKEIEIEIGRIKREKWFQREIDIDIVFYDTLIVNSKTLIIPHKLMHERNFVLTPLLEIIKDWKHPVFDKTISELSYNCTDKNLVTKLDLN